MKLDKGRMLREVFGGDPLDHRQWSRQADVACLEIHPELHRYSHGNLHFCTLPFGHRGQHMMFPMWGKRQEDWVPKATWGPWEECQAEMAAMVKWIDENRHE